MKIKTRKRIRKDDKVLVISGNNRGKSGEVFRVLEDRIYVRGVNLRKKHVRPTRTSKGGIIEMEMPIHISNVRVCIGEDKPVKLRSRTNENQQKELYYADDTQQVVYRVIGKKVIV